MEAQVLFVGRDPNWAFDIETKEMFNYVSEYLTDGVTFWETYHIHHPFLLPNYYQTKCAMGLWLDAIPRWSAEEIKTCAFYCNAGSLQGVRRQSD